MAASSVRRGKAALPRGGFAHYEGSIRNKVALVYAAQAGVYIGTLFDAADLTGIHREQLAELLNLSMKTLLRYQQENRRLGPASSEWLLKLIAIFRQGETVFGRVDSFRAWLQKPAFGLGNQRPFDLLPTVSGMDLIADELSRIEYGDLA